MFTHSGAQKNSYLNGFLGIGQDNQKIFTNAFDEPTYLTIRVDFFPSSDDIVNSSYIENKVSTSCFEYMPEPLLEMDSSLGYNTINYLKAHGDDYRADLLEKFRNGLFDLSKNCPFYVTNVEGLAEIVNVNPARGTRTKQDSYLKLTCNEGLDMRITALLDMYKKIAWDDTFQRWILPDMMRYFKMDITITEFRIFTEIDKQTRKFLNSETLRKLSYPGQLVDLIAPSIRFECYMCEFMFDEMYNHLSSFSVSDPRANSTKPIIKIKIGNIKQDNTYTLFKGDENLLICDIINGRTNEKDNVHKQITKINLYNRETVPAANNEIDSANENEAPDIKRTRNASSLSTLNTISNVVKNVKNNLSINKTIKNALTSIVAEADGVADDWLNDMMFKPLGKTNLSFNTILNAVTSNDIRTMYNTFKIKAEAIKELYPELSDVDYTGNGDIAVDAFKSLLAASTMIEPKTEIESGIKEISKALLEYDSKERVKKIDDFIDLIYDATDALDAFGDKKKIINKNLSDIYSSVTETPKTIKKIIL
jgi:hypothetical protein